MKGPGKYDELCTHVREQTNAEAVIVMVIGGNRGTGFSCQAPLDIQVMLPVILRNVATQIEDDGPISSTG